MFVFLQRAVAVFPDTKSDRASRHVEELIRAVESGSYQAALLFLVQRGDCTAFAPCYEKDPRYANLLRQAQQAGVLIIPIQCELQQKKTGVDTETLQDEYSIVWKPRTPLPCILDFKRPSS
jgi:DNA-binding sugar fermentation-stimulating protein